MVGTFAQDLQLSQWQDRSNASKQVLSLKQQFPKGRTALYSAWGGQRRSLGMPNLPIPYFSLPMVTTISGQGNRSKSSNLWPLVAFASLFSWWILASTRHRKSARRQRAWRNLRDKRGVVLRLPWSKEWISSGAALAKQIQRAAASPYEVDFQLATPMNKSAKLKLETSFGCKRFTFSYPHRLEPYMAESQP